MKKQIMVLCCLMMLFMISGCHNIKHKKETIHTNNEKANMKNPFVDYKTLAEASSASGIDLTVPEDVIVFYKEKKFRAIKDTLIEVQYIDKNDKLCIRKGTYTEKDIPGDFNPYKEKLTLPVGDIHITIHGQGNLYYVATWTKDGYTYAITNTIGLSQENILTLMKGIK